MSRFAENAEVQAERIHAAEQFSSAPRPFRPTALHVGSTVIHVGALGAALAVPQAWPWALAAVGANHLFNAAQSFFPRGRLNGPVLAHLPDAWAKNGAIALTFDDGPDPNYTLKVLDELDAHGARATFFCVGQRVRQHAALARTIIERGHAVENHSYSHATSSGFWSARRWRADIDAAQNAISDATGVKPIFFRPPFGVRTPWLEPALARCGLHCVTWSARAFDTQTSDAAKIDARLRPNLLPGAIVLLHDSVAVGRAQDRSVLFDVLPLVFAGLKRRSLHSISLRALISSPSQ